MEEIPDSFVEKLMARSRMMAGRFDGKHIEPSARSRHLQRVHLFIQVLEILKTLSILVWPAAHVELYTNEMKVTSSARLQMLQNITLAVSHFGIYSIGRFYFDCDLRRLRWTHSVILPVTDFKRFLVTTAHTEQHFRFRRFLKRVGVLSANTLTVVPCLMVARGLYESCKFLGPTPYLLVCLLCAAVGLLSIVWGMHGFLFNIYIMLLGLNILVVRMRGARHRLDCELHRRSEVRTSLGLPWMEHLNVLPTDRAPRPSLDQLTSLLTRHLTKQHADSDRLRPMSSKGSKFVQRTVREQKRIVADFFQIAHVFSKALTPIILASFMFLFIFPYMVVFGDDPMHVKLLLIAFYLALLVCSVWVICLSNEILCREV